MVQAVESVWEMLRVWVHQPGARSTEALQWLSNFPAVVQGLVQVGGSTCRPAAASCHTYGGVDLCMRVKHACLHQTT